MEDALISPVGFMILSGAGLIEAGEKNTIKVHTTEQTDKISVEVDPETSKVTGVSIVLSDKPYVKEAKYHEDMIYVMALDNGEVVTEPYIPDHSSIVPVKNVDGEWVNLGDEEDESVAEGYQISLIAPGERTEGSTIRPNRAADADDLDAFLRCEVVLVDYYVEKASSAYQIEITPDKFGGNYYLEASTLFRDTNGVDMPAEFVIPNCKIQSNFSFAMSSSGDPSTFTFTMDAFPDYTRFDPTKKVLAAIQIIETGNSDDVLNRTRTVHDVAHDRFLK